MSKMGEIEIEDNIVKLTQYNEQISVSNNTRSQDNTNNKKAQEVDIQETLNEDEFVEYLDVADTCDDDEKDKPRRRSWDRSRGKDKRNSRDLGKEREEDRENFRARRRSDSVEKKKELARRDPNKSNKDIEQDKIRTKKNNDNKILAEKEKAIKTLLDSDNVVPPGTEGEAIQNLVDKNQQVEEESSRKGRRNSRDNRRRSLIRSRLVYRRLSPRRSPIRRSPGRSSDRRRSPITFSPDRRRRRSSHQLSPDERRHRGCSFERENSAERREASRRRLREREAKYGRRSRSRDRRSLDRHRSRSTDRYRRSPFDRHSPRRLLNPRRRSLSRSPLRSPTRSRRRSPFINELARQFQNDSVRIDNAMAVQQPLSVMHSMGSGGSPFIPPGGGPPGVHPGGPQPMDPRMMTVLMPTSQRMIPGPPGAGGPGMPPGPMDMHPGSQGMPGPSGPPFVNYEGCQSVPPGMNFDTMNRGMLPPDHSSTPMMYNQGNQMPPINTMPHSHSMQPSSPQPVPAPGQGPSGALMYNFGMGLSLQHQPPNMLAPPDYSPNSYLNRNSISPSDFMFRKRSKREERMKTPEPPIISDFKQNEKTSLSSLLEASVSTKDPSNSTISFRGFRPEIIRHCERALRSLPAEDPRLQMKGRFFFDPSKKDKTETTSNSILLRKGRTEIHWDDEDNQSASAKQHHHLVKPAMVDFAMQICPQDLIQSPHTKDERRSVTERLDWSLRETYDHQPKLRDNDDLRWSLTNNSARDRQMHSWSRSFSPNLQTIVGGPVQISTVDNRCNMDILRERSSIDRSIDVRDRNMDTRGRCMGDLRDRDINLRDVRTMEMMRERERERDREREIERERMLDAMDSRGNMMDGGRGSEEYRNHREPMNDYDVHNSFGNSYNRAMESMDRERKEMQTRGGSPVILDDDSEELEIIEERLLEREQCWQSRTEGNTLLQFNNNARGAVGSSSNRSNASMNRSFGGRLTNYRINF